MSEQLDRIEKNQEEMLEILRTAPPPPPPPDEPIRPDLKRVEMRVKAPLMEISHYDAKGKPVLRIHKYGILRKRIIAKQGKELIIVGKATTAQGIAFKLYSGQQVDGVWLTETNTRASIPGTKNPKRYDKYFHIKKALVRML